MIPSRPVHGGGPTYIAAGLPWTIVQLGARAEYRFCPRPPRTGGESTPPPTRSSTSTCTSTPSTAGC